MTYHFVGETRSRIRHAGKLDGPLEPWVVARFEANWRSLAVYRDADGVRVAGIEPYVPNRSKRRWWCEVSAELPEPEPAALLRVAYGWGTA